MGSNENNPDQPATLRRSLSLPLVVLYGLGTTVGAGIYALIGEIAGTAAAHVPLSFLLAGAVAGFSAFTFAEMSARYPKSAGEAIYVREGLGLPRLALVVGLLVATAGIVSAATIVNGFVGYLGEILLVGHATAVLGIVILMFAIAAWGIGESVRVAAAVTIVEVGGLLLIVWVAGDATPTAAATLVGTPPAWEGIFAGAILAFYAFLGFEDMVNVVEEVKEGRRTLPRAIIVTLIVTLFLYTLLSLAAIGVVPPAELAESSAPLVLVWTRATGGSGTLISWIGIAALINGALIQIIMASRVLYGLSRQGWLPSALSRVSSRTQTPVTSTLIVAGLVALLALAFPLGPLARATSLIVLLVFALVNASLWRLKRRGPPSDQLATPMIVPVLGLVTSLGLLLFELAGLLT